MISNFILAGCAIILVLLAGAIYLLVLYFRLGRKEKSSFRRGSVTDSKILNSYYSLPRTERPRERVPRKDTIQFCGLTATPQEIIDRLPQFAADHVILSRKLLGTEYDLSEQGLYNFEKDLTAKLIANEALAERFFVLGFASFLGECLRCSMGGSWSFVDDSSLALTAVKEMDIEVHSFKIASSCLNAKSGAELKNAITRLRELLDNTTSQDPRLLHGISKGRAHMQALVYSNLKHCDIEVFKRSHMRLTLSRNMELDLEEIASECAKVPVKQWSTLIEWKIRDDMSRYTSAIQSEFSEIAANLSVRLEQLSTVENNKSEFIYSTHLEGTATVAVIKENNAIRDVTQTDLIRWGKSLNEIMELALENLRKSSDATPTATHALILDEIPQSTGKFGSLVAVPQKDTLLLQPLDSEANVSVMQELLPRLRSIHTNGEQPLSDNLYFYRDGNFFLFHNKDMGDGRVELAPPIAFLRALQEMRKAS